MFSMFKKGDPAAAAKGSLSANASSTSRAPPPPANAVPPGFIATNVPGVFVPSPTNAGSQQPAGFANPNPHHHSSHAASSSRPDAQALTRSRQQRQAELAAAAFGAPLAPATVQPPRAGGGGHHPSYSGGGGGYTAGGPPGGFAGETLPPGGGMGGLGGMGGMGGIGGMGGMGGMSMGGPGGGDDFDMFGGLDVKGSDAASSLPPSNSSNSLPTSSSFNASSSYPAAAETEGGSSLLSALNGSEEASSSFSFMSDESAGTTTDTAGGYDASSGFSFISADDSQLPPFSEPTYDEQQQYNVDATPAPPVPADKLAATKQRIDATLSSFWSQWRSLAAAESGLIQEEVQLQLTVRDSLASIKETEDKQGAAVAAEEYEKADSYNAELDRLKLAIGSANDRLKSVRSDIDQQVQQKQAAITAVLATLSESTGALQDITNEKQGELSSFVSETTAALIQSDTQVKDDMRVVEEALSHTQSDIDAIDKEESALTDALKAETQPFVDEKENLLTEEHTLERDLEELKRQVAAKEKEIQQNRAKQASADNAIEVCKAKNQQQRHGIHARRANVDELRSTDVARKREIEARRSQLEDEIAASKARERTYRITLHEIALSLAHTQYLSALLAAESKQREAFHTQLRTAEQQIAALQSSLDSHDATVASQRNELVQLEQQLDQHTKTIESIATKLPALETEKNAAVTARDFKKAATASKTIKELQQSKTDSEAVLSELKEKVTKWSEELGSADEKKADMEREIQRLEQHSDRRRLAYLLSREQKLQRRVDKTAAVLQRELERGSGGEGLGYLQKEKESGEVELQWTQVEVRELRRKYGWSESDVRAQAEEDEEEEAEVVSHVDDPSPFDSVHSHSTPAASSVASLGVPVIHARKISRAASPAAKPTPADAERVKAELEEARTRLTSSEEKLAAAVEGEDFEAAAELEERVANEKAAVERLEVQLSAIEKELGDGEAEERKEVEANGTE